MTAFLPITGDSARHLAALVDLHSSPSGELVPTWDVEFLPTVTQALPPHSAELNAGQAVTLAVALCRAFVACIDGGLPYSPQSLDRVHLREDGTPVLARPGLDSARRAETSSLAATGDTEASCWRDGLQRILVDVVDVTEDSAESRRMRVLLKTLTPRSDFADVSELGEFRASDDIVTSILRIEAGLFAIAAPAPLSPVTSIPGTLFPAVPRLIVQPRMHNSMLGLFTLPEGLLTSWEQAWDRAGASTLLARLGQLIVEHRRPLTASAAVGVLVTTTAALMLR